MIFNNFVTTGTALTATIWNRAWGFAGTAASNYDAIGGQQYYNTTFSSSSWATATQEIVAPLTVQFSFVNGTYTSSNRSGNFNNWISGMSPEEDLRDNFTAQRSGYHILQCDVALADVSNRIGSSTNTDGIDTVPNRSLNVYILKNDDALIYAFRSSSMLPNTIKAATGNGPQFVQPYICSAQTFLVTAIAGDRFKIVVDPVSTRNDRVVYAAIKGFLMKSININNQYQII
jgi:hypothetical protein